MSTIYYATVQENKDLQSSIFTTLKNKTKHNTGSLYIVLIGGDIAFKDCASSLRYVQRQHGTSTEHLGQINSSFHSLSSLPPEDILIVNALEQRAKHS